MEVEVSKALLKKLKQYLHYEIEKHCNFYGT